MELMSQDQETVQQVAEEIGTIACDPETESLLEQLQGVIAQFQRMIDCRSYESLQAPGHDGHWGVVEILCYLRDWEAVVHERVRRIIEEDVPALMEPDTAMWPLDHEYGAQDSYDAFHDLAVLRGSLIGRLREMDPAQWERTGVFERDGELTLRDYLREVVAHDERYVQEAREAVA